MMSHKKREGKISKLNFRRMPDNFHHFAIKNEIFGHQESFSLHWTRDFGTAAKKSYVKWVAKRVKKLLVLYQHFEEIAKNGQKDFEEVQETE